MPVFDYVARDKNGDKVKGQQNAATKDELLAQLQSKGYVVSSIIEKPEAARSPVSADGAKASDSNKGKHGWVTKTDLLLFARQLATMINAGVSILKSLQIMQKQTESRNMAEILAKVVKDMESGVTLHDALGKHKKVFSELWVNLIETGEASGNLGLVLERLATYLERQESLKSKIISAMIYPIILMVVAVGAILVFLLKIFPMFSAVFSDFGMELPPLTQMMIHASNLLKKGFLPGIVIIVVLVFMFRQYIGTTAGRRNYDIFLLKLPLIGGLVKIVALERFASTMSTLVQSGVPILYSLEITERTIGNKLLEDTLKKVKENVRGGKTLSGPLEESGLFPAMVIQMVGVGEEIGELPQMFKRIADYYSEVIETLITRLTAAFEPIMLVVMAGIIGMMVVGMFLPILKLSQIGG